MFHGFGVQRHLLSGMILQDTSHRQWIYHDLLILQHWCSAWGFASQDAPKKTLSQSMSFHDRSEYSGKKLPQQLYKTSNIWKISSFSELHNHPTKISLGLQKLHESLRIREMIRPKKPGFARSNPTLYSFERWDFLSLSTSYWIGRSREGLLSHTCLVLRVSLKKIAGLIKLLGDD